jgi:hypothetical protein
MVGDVITVLCVLLQVVVSIVLCAHRARCNRRLPGLYLDRRIGRLGLPSWPDVSKQVDLYRLYSGSGQPW